MSKILFQWDTGNLNHVLIDHPERGNTQREVESLFSDPYFSPLPDRIDQHGEQQFSGVAVGNEGIEKHVVYVMRKGYIRPITCRRATKKQRIRYGEIVKEIVNQQQKDG